MLVTCREALKTPLYTTCSAPNALHGACRFNEKNYWGNPLTLFQPLGCKQFRSDKNLNVGVLSVKTMTAALKLLAASPNSRVVCNTMNLCIGSEAVVFVIQSVAGLPSPVLLPPLLHHFSAFYSHPGSWSSYEAPPLPLALLSSDPDAVYPWSWARTLWLPAAVSQWDIHMLAL